MSSLIMLRLWHRPAEMEMVYNYTTMGLIFLTSAQSCLELSVSVAALAGGCPSGGLEVWWTSSVSKLSGKRSLSSTSCCCSLTEGSSGCSSEGAGVPCPSSFWRRLKRLFRSFLSFCRARHKRSSSSSFPCRALKCPSRRVFWTTQHRLIIKRPFLCQTQFWFSLHVCVKAWGTQQWDLVPHPDTLRNISVDTFVSINMPSLSSTSINYPFTSMQWDNYWYFQRSHRSSAAALSWGALVLTSSAICSRAWLLLSHLLLHCVVSFSSFLIFLVI